MWIVFNRAIRYNGLHAAVVLLLPLLLLLVLLPIAGDGLSVHVYVSGGAMRTRPRAQCAGSLMCA